MPSEGPAASLSASLSVDVVVLELSLVSDVVVEGLVSVGWLAKVGSRAAGGSSSGCGVAVKSCDRSNLVVLAAAIPLFMS